jgi:hypothetical protein
MVELREVLHLGFIWMANDEEQELALKAEL